MIKPTVLGPGLAALVALSLGFMGGWEGCDLGSVSGDSLPAIDTVSHVAKLRVSNQLLKNPGTLSFYLYGSSASNIIQATVSKTIGDVDENQTKSFTVPSGTWKIGYSLNGQLVEMPDPDTSGAGWPKIQFSDKGDYSLKVYTDPIDNRNYWKYSFAIIP